MNYKGIEYLRRKLALKRTRVLTRYKYYEMKNSVAEYDGTLPERLRYIREALGWCAKAVDTLADRIVFDEFSDDTFYLNQIYNLNNRDILVDSAVLSALISSCSFVYISADEDGYPRLQVIDGANATGVIDPITNLLNEGYAVLERDDYDKVVLEAYFTAEHTEFYRDGRLYQSVNNPAPYALLVPIIYRPDARREFGHSRISRACMQLTQTALRTLKRSEISAEFYSFPQKYVLGMNTDAEFNNARASMSSFLRIDKDEDGDKPSVGQFSQQSMSPYTEQLKSIASLFAGETGLTLDDLGFATSNPSSAEAIKASHESLRLTARKAQRSFGSGLLNAGYLAACVRDEKSYQRKAFYKTTPLWLPIFEPDAASLGTIGDSILKINQASDGYFGERNIKQLVGFSGDNNSTTAQTIVAETEEQ